jgi:hypothetical protein
MSTTNPATLHSLRPDEWGVVCEFLPKPSLSLLTLGRVDKTMRETLTPVIQRESQRIGQAFEGILDFRSCEKGIEQLKQTDPAGYHRHYFSRMIMTIISIPQLRENLHVAKGDFLAAAQAQRDLDWGTAIRHFIGFHVERFSMTQTEAKKISNKFAAVFPYYCGMRESAITQDVKQFEQNFRESIVARAELFGPIEEKKEMGLESHFKDHAVRISALKDKYCFQAVGKSLASIPLEIARFFPDLQSLELMGNNIRTISQAIFDLLPNLKYLNLRANPVRAEDIPEVVKRCKEENRVLLLDSRVLSPGPKDRPKKGSCSVQ